MAEGDVGGVKSAKAASQGHAVRIPVLLLDEGHDFVDEVVLVLDVAGDAPARRDVAVVPALVIHRVDAVELDLAVVDLVGDAAGQAAVFKFEKAPAGRGKNEDGHAGVAEDQQFHVAAQAMGIPLVILAIQALYLVRVILGGGPIFDTVTATGSEEMCRQWSAEDGQEAEGAIGFGNAWGFVSDIPGAAGLRTGWAGWHAVPDGEEAETPHPRLRVHRGFRSRVLPDRRDLIVYVPPGYDEDAGPAVSRAVYE